jgi:hypothetical protein
LDIGGSGGLGI